MRGKARITLDDKEALHLEAVISGSSRLVTAVGLDEIVVVEDKDSVLVARKDKTQNVKELVDELKKQDREETRLHRQVFRPWGSYDSIDADDGFQVKRLIVNPGAVLSLQKTCQKSRALDRSARQSADNLG